jgi:hypothetical protein
VEAGYWRKDIRGISVSLHAYRKKKATAQAKINREKYSKIFNRRGSVEWQDIMVQKGKT